MGCASRGRAVEQPLTAPALSYGPEIQEPREFLQLEQGGEMTDIPLRVPHSIYSFFWCEGQPPGSGACFAWALPLGCIPAWVHDVYLGEAHTELEILKESESVWSTEKGKRRGRRDPSRIGDRGRAGGGCRRGGAGRTFLASLSAPSRAIRPAGGRWSGQTMARRSAEPGTKFGVAFAGLGAARSSPCKGETK